ncbi:hypothetical protein PG994_012566 [Apiospora phragmitis]|uniref:Uncharacterized protein n=1 Tax=Apiospora phragmitis TaxID=2905665 RepID=A0ABR1TDG2_9PEZI
MKYVGPRRLGPVDVRGRRRLRRGADLDHGGEGDAGRHVLDPALRDMIAWFCAALSKQLPDLYSAMELCFFRCRNIKNSTSPLNSDAAIRDLVQRLVFDADFQPNTFFFDFEDQWDEYDPDVEKVEEGGQQDGDKMDEDKQDGDTNDESTMMASMSIK